MITRQLIAKQKQEKSESDILNELLNEVAPQNNQEKTIPPLVKVNDKYRFEDGKRLYNSKESAINAITGFHKFQDKREETSQFIYKKSYEDVTKDMTETERKQYDKSLSSRHK